MMFHSDSFLAMILEDRHYSRLGSVKEFGLILIPLGQV